MITRFFIYGIAGLVIEVLWTSMGAMRRGDRRLTGYTYLWMLPIYGSAVFLEPVCISIMNLPVFMRGIIYMVCIFAAEFAAGYGLEKLIGVCPWDYSGCRYSVFGFIRLDYASCWFAVGLMFEMGFRFLSQ